MEFEESDYQEARSLADSIKIHAENIKDILDHISSNMRALTGTAYRSMGSDNVYLRYQLLAAKYDGFYNKVVDLNKAIHKITDKNEEEDVRVSESLEETIEHII